jgi:hypothetical protein
MNFIKSHHTEVILCTKNHNLLLQLLQLDYVVQNLSPGTINNLIFDSHEYGGFIFFTKILEIYLV